MQQKLPPGVVTAIIAVVVIVVALLAWRTLAQPPSGNAGAQQSGAAGSANGAPVTNPAAQAQFGSPRFSRSGYGARGAR